MTAFNIASFLCFIFSMVLAMEETADRIDLQQLISQHDPEMRMIEGKFDEINPVEFKMVIATMTTINDLDDSSLIQDYVKKTLACLVFT